MSSTLTRVLCRPPPGFACEMEWVERVSAADTSARAATQTTSGAALIRLSECDAEGRLGLPLHTFLIPGTSASVVELIAGMHAATSAALRELTNGLSMGLGMIEESDADCDADYGAGDFPRRLSHRMSELPDMLAVGNLGLDTYDNQSPEGDSLYDLSAQRRRSELQAGLVFEDNGAEALCETATGPSGKFRRATITDIDGE